MTRLTLADLRELCDRYVPDKCRHEDSFDRAVDWWPSHELGHLLTVARWRIGREMFGLDGGPERELRSHELAAMSVSRRLLETAGRRDLARAEYHDTDDSTLHYYDDRGRVNAILRRHRVVRLPTTRGGLERILQRAVRRRLAPNIT